MTGQPRPPDTPDRDDDDACKPTRIVIPGRIMPAVPRDREAPRDRRRIHEPLPTPVYPDPQRESQ